MSLPTVGDNKHVFRALEFRIADRSVADLHPMEDYRTKYETTILG